MKRVRFQFGLKGLFASTAAVAALLTISINVVRYVPSFVLGSLAILLLLVILQIGASLLVGRLLVSLYFGAGRLFGWRKPPEA